MGVLFQGSHTKDHSILGFILGVPYFGKLPFTAQGNGGVQGIGLLFTCSRASEARRFRPAPPVRSKPRLLKSRTDEAASGII